MYRQHDTELTAALRDTSGHHFSVTLQLMLAVICFLGLTLFHVKTDFNWIVWGLIFYAVPVQLTLAALRELVGHRKAKARQLDGFDDLPPIKSTSKMTSIVFGTAILIVLLMMNGQQGMNALRTDSFGNITPSLGPLIGIFIFLALWGYKFYIAIWRPQTQPNIAPSRDDVISQSKRILGRGWRGAATHLVITVVVMGVFLFYIIYWPEVAAPQPMSLL